MEFAKITSPLSGTDLGASGSQVEVLIRPDAIAESSTSAIRASIENRVFAGSTTLYTLRVASGHVLDALFPSNREHHIGDEIGISIHIEHLLIFPDRNARS